MSLCIASVLFYVTALIVGANVALAAPSGAKLIKNS